MVEKHSGIELAFFQEDGCSWTCGMNVFGYRLNAIACVAPALLRFFGPTDPF
jgi:hypothetical protein